MVHVIDAGAKADGSMSWVTGKDGVFEHTTSKDGKQRFVYLKRAKPFTTLSDRARKRACARAYLHYCFAVEFTPQPDVDSALVRIVKRDGAVFSDELYSFFKICFAQKRKLFAQLFRARRRRITES